MDCEDHHMALGFLFFSVCYGISITWHLKPILGIVLDLDEANFDTFFPCYVNCHLYTWLDTDFVIPFHIP
jgi:hypothetical protein